MVTNLMQPNSDHQMAMTLLKTLLPGDLFQLFAQTSKISPFVNGSFSLYPELTAQMLIWHNTTEDNQVKADLADALNAFVCLHEASETAVMTSLRIFRRAHSAAIAVLELSDHMSIQSSSLRISLLADCLINASYHWSYASLQPRFGIPLDEAGTQQQMLILAMGKLGGFELNFSSDIDLIFFYPQDGQTANGNKTTNNADFFRRVSTQLIKLLDEITQDGFVFRVDMRLRPYGDSGALVMSLNQAEEYYQEQGREWERFAMIRARVISEDNLNSDLLNNILRPFSFRRYIDYGVIESIRNMKEMIQREVRRKGLTDNIKLGAGGIREVEFIVQSLQLIQGGRDKRLQQKNTFKVLPLLVDSKMLPAETAQSLHKAYAFLRRLEHCIQELGEKQTQQLPTSELEQSAICQAMKFADWPALLLALQAIQSSVNQHFNELFGEERQHPLAQDDFFKSLAEGFIDPPQLQQKLEQKRSLADNGTAEFSILSEAQAESFCQQVAKFMNEPAVLNLTSRGGKRLRAFLPALLAVCLTSKFPEITLARLIRVLQSILKRTAYLELLSENPPILQHLVDLVGQSEWVAMRLAEYPILFDELLYPNSLYEPLQTADLLAELQQALLRINEEDEEQLLDALRVFKQINELRIAAALLAQRLSISQVSRYLTQLAEVILQSSVEQCWRLLKVKHGVPTGLSGQPGDYGFAVIGYGKLGGYELGFGSDLDLVFLYNQPAENQTNGNKPVSNSRFYTRLAQKIIHFISTRTNSGMLYEVDMRLRPSGSAGLLVSHIDAYRDYQWESAWTWEHQALVRARCIVGDATLREQFEAVRFKTLSKPRDLTQLKFDVNQMRDKMRQQKEKTNADKVDLKQAVGGLVDIEFIAQFIALSYRGKLPVPHNMVDCFKLAKDEKVIEVEEAQTLIKTYRLLRNKINEQTLIAVDNVVAKEEFEASLNSVKLIWEKYLPEEFDELGKPL